MIRYDRIRKAIITLQVFMRSICSFCIDLSHVQAFGRMVIAMTRYRKQLAAIITIQSFFRMVLVLAFIPSSH